MGTLGAFFPLLLALAGDDELDARGRALLAEHGPGYRVLETVSYRYVLPLDGERYVGQVMTPIEATHDRFYLDAARLGWELARPATKPEIVLFADGARLRAYCERRGLEPEDGHERASGRLFLHDLGQDEEFTHASARERLAANIAAATRGAARQLWYASGFLQPSRAYPAWLVDGLAIALERDATHESASLFHDGRRPRLAALRAGAERGALLPLARWIDSSERDGLARSSLRAGQAWALVRHALEDRRASLPEYVRALDQGLAPAVARERVFGPLAELESAYLARLALAAR